MCSLFDAVDQGWPAKHINHFNGGLFKRDSSLDDLRISDDVFNDFKKISKYEFQSDLSVNLLGHIFKQAINDIDAARNGLTISTKRKKDGIFYTPVAITDYILQETLQAWTREQWTALGLSDTTSLTENEIQTYRAFIEKRGMLGSRKIQQQNAVTRKVADRLYNLQQYRDRLRQIRILDPAVGSGSFLNRAFDLLRDEQIQIDNQLQNITGVTDLWDFNSNILSRNLYGVDINPESVEISKLSLWLKTANKENPLTSLDANLRAGNSIIDSTSITNLAFDWKQEFPEIMVRDRGFDIVIGNPPYVFSSENFTVDEKEYYSANYDMSEYQKNLYRIFTEKGWRLLKYDGWFGFIIPNTWFSNKYFSKMRKFLRSKTTNLKVIAIKDKVFPDASVDTSLVIFKKHIDSKNNSMTVGEWVHGEVTYLQEQNFPEDLSSVILINKSDSATKRILDRIGKSEYTLKDFARVTAGIELFERGKGIPKQPTDKEEFKHFKQSNDFFSRTRMSQDYYPYFDGSDVIHYATKSSSKFLRYGSHLAAKRKLEDFSGEHLVCRRIPETGYHMLVVAKQDGVTLHEQAVWNINRLENTAVSLDYLNAIISSKVISYWIIYTLGLLTRSTFPQLRSYHILELPIPKASSVTTNSIIQEMNKIQVVAAKLVSNEERFVATLRASWPGYEGSFDFKDQVEFQRIMINTSPIRDRADLVQQYERYVDTKTSLGSTFESLQKSIDHLVAVAFGLNAADELTLNRTLEDVLNHNEKS
ncbi:Eco57I restriction-modification methylase domain-containing protein [Lacticaseibacillus paracasei]|uniref:Eco57I restriction-modification methylase domain-containing protein n=1 Tax=Lacticaseibacillus paracasei TaxID=1597 RepID=UPI0040457FED